MTVSVRNVARLAPTSQRLLAALVGPLLLLAGILVGTVPAAAGNGVGASTPIMINSVGAATGISPGQRLGTTVLRPGIVVATGVAADGGESLYRGVNVGHPKLHEALTGRAEPLGGHSDPALHNGGNPYSEFTSWSTDPGIAYDAAMEYGPGGVVLRIPAKGANIVPSVQDIYVESEVLIKGPVSGADATDAWEFGKPWGFNESR